MLSDKNLLAGKQYNLWHQMVNFDQSPNGNGTPSFLFGFTYGWFYFFIKLFDLKLGWEFLLTLSKGVISAVIIWLAVKVMSAFYEVKWEKKLKDKISKFKINGRKDKQKAA